PVAAGLAARRIHRVIAADVESVELEGRFDLVLALELFEHLTRQEEFLARMRGLLAADGALLLSVPNVGHGALVEDLIAGRFDYLPVGLLCYTHYRFFTRAALERWFERGGFSRVEIVGQPLAPPAGLAERLAAAGLEVDRESLATGGFFVVARI
ncbi:MAG: class I SAM-dependent methyltransferase, partial [Thermoanaerobaculia bacterium]|nr:class I SAM-dependent methyltransferase [Thermoanaerobaculia bacterium]